MTNPHAPAPARACLLTRRLRVRISLQVLLVRAHNFLPTTDIRRGKFGDRPARSFEIHPPIDDPYIEANAISQCIAENSCLSNPFLLTQSMRIPTISQLPEGYSQRCLAHTSPMRLVVMSRTWLQSTMVPMQTLETRMPEYMLLATMRLPPLPQVDELIRRAGFR